MKMSGKTYDVLKFWAWLWVPLTTLCITILGAWKPDWQYMGALKDTLIAIEVFLGALVSKSNYDYNQERLEVRDDDNE